jgi:outer membrane protein TolC
VIQLPRLAACALAGSLAGAPAWAQPAASPPVAAAPAPLAAPAVITLREALDAAWQRAVQAREADARRRLAEAERLGAAKPWAAPPILELNHRADRLLSGGGGRETEVGIAVPLWLPGQRTARTGTLDAAAAQALAAEQAARLHLAGELREVAWHAAALEAEVNEADAQVMALRRLSDDVGRRLRAGDVARADSLAAQAELLAAAAAQADVRQRLQVARAQWTLLTGLTARPDLSGAAASDPNLPDTSGHPERQLARQTTELARKRVDLMRQSRREAPELTLGVRHDAPGRGEASQGSLIVGLRLPFGTEDRNRPLEVAALSELDIAQTQEQRLQERLDANVAGAREALRSARARLDAEVARARLLRERAGLIDQSFRAGETPLPDLLRALAAAAQADSAVARQNASPGLSQARLHQSLGLLP